MEQGTLCDHIDYPPAFGGVPAFNLSEAAFRASNLPFQPKDMYVQHTLDYEPFLPLYKAVVQYAQSLNVTLTTRGDAHITVCAQPSNCCCFLGLQILQRRCNAGFQD